MRAWKEMLWKERDKYIRANWGRLSSRAMGAALGCRPDDVRERGRALGLDPNALLEAKRQAARNNAEKARNERQANRVRKEKYRMEQAKVQERGYFVWIWGDAKDGEADVRKAVERQPELVGVWK